MLKHTSLRTTVLHQREGPSGPKLCLQGGCKRLCWSMFVSTLLLHSCHVLASTSCCCGGVCAEGSKISLKKPPHPPEASSAYQAVLAHEQGEETTVNTWACAHGETRGGTYGNELRGNGWTLRRSRGDRDNKRTAYSSLRT